jgi:hypothetical protein
LAEKTPEWIFFRVPCKKLRRDARRVVMTDGGSEVIERKGKDAKEAARLALERLRHGLRPFRDADLFAKLYQPAEFFGKYSSYCRDSLVV